MVEIERDRHRTITLRYADQILKVEECKRHSAMQSREDGRAAASDLSLRRGGRKVKNVIAILNKYKTE